VMEGASDATLVGNWQLAIGNCPTRLDRLVMHMQDDDSQHRMHGPKSRVVERIGHVR
jgi:hypothetical protein